MNVPEIRQARAKAEDARDAIGQRMIGLAEVGGDAYDAAVKEFDALASEVGRLTRELEREIEREQVAARNGTVRQLPEGTLGWAVRTPLESGSGVSFKTADGAVVRALKNTEKLSDVVARGYSESSAIAEVGLGGLVKAFAFGPTSTVERAALGESSATAGGFLVPSVLSAQVIDLARAQARTLQAGVQTVPMERGNLTLAKVISDPTASWRGENQTIASSGMEFGAINLSGHSVAALVKLSRELVEDAPNASAVVQNAILAQLALAIDEAILYGTGTGYVPKGIKARVADGDVNSIPMGDNGAAFTGYGKFIDAVQAIASANGPDAGLAAIMNPRTRADLERLADTTGQPLTPPESFRNLTRFTSNQIPTNFVVGSGTGCSDVILGDFSQVLLGVANSIQIEVSRDASDSDGSAFANHQVWVKAVARLDVGVMREQWLSVISGIKAAS